MSRLQLVLVARSAALCAVLLGCSEIDPTNPVDPGAPETVQAEGTLSGTIALPEGFDPALVADARLELRRFSAPAEVAYVAEVDPQGAFSLRVQPATYLASARLRGFSVEPIQAQVELGARVELGELRLVPVADGEVRGQAIRAGLGEGAHGGLVVEAEGTPYLTSTTEDGAFRLQLNRGRHRLVFRGQGYARVVVEVEVEPTAHLEPVELSGDPGVVRGTVRAPAGFDADTVEGGQVRLFAPGSDAPLDTRVVDSAGAFVFREVPAGSWRVQVEVAGYHPDERALTLHVGEDRDLGVISLFSTLGAGGVLTGTALLEGQADGGHGGIRIELEGTPVAAVTGPDGRFRITVPELADDTLRFSHSGGYDTRRVEGVDLAAGAMRALESVTLTGASGRVRGSVGLGGDLGLPAQAVADAFVNLLQGEQRVAEDEPDDLGAFLLPTVPAGEYTLEVRRDGFQAVRRPLQVDRGATSDVGHIVLEPSALQVRIAGRALLDRRAAGHEGTTVALEDSGLRTETAPDGSYSLLAPLRQAGYRLRFSRVGYNGEQALAASPPAEAVNAAIEAGAEWVELAVDPAEVVLAGLPGSIRGRVSLAAGFEDPQLLADIAIRLFDFADPEAPVANRAPDAEGFFLFEDLPAGDYQLEYRLRNFVTQTQQTPLAPGGRAVVDAVVLSPDLASSRAFVDGVVRRGCADCDHGGILVEVLNRPFVTVSSSTGQYRLEVVAGQDYTLRFSAAGYDSLDRGQVDALANQVTVVEAVELPARPATVRAIVRLARLQTPARLGAVSIELLPAGGGDALDIGSPDEEGDAVFRDVRPGEYQLRFQATGYAPQVRGVVLAPGGDAFAGLVELQHKSTTAAQVPLVATVLLADRQEHQGTRVEVRLHPDDLLLAEAGTDAAGRVELAAAPDERYQVRYAREGYAEPPQRGPVAWDEVDARFEFEDGSPLDLNLERDPIDGRLTVRVAVEPPWLPPAERFARVVLSGPESRIEEPVFAGGDGVSFAGLLEGTYTLRIERQGFSSVERQVTLTQATPQIDLGVLSVRLTDLAVARLDLRGRALDACDLRGGLALRGADLSGVTLTGDFGANDGCGEGSVEGPLDLSNARLVGADLTGARLAAEVAPGVNLSGAELGGASLVGVDLRRATAVGARFAGADLERAVLARADLRGASFDGARLVDALFVDAQLELDGDPPVLRPRRDPESAWPDLGVPQEAWAEIPCQDRCDGGLLPAGSCPEIDPRPEVRLEGATFARADLSGAFLPGTLLGGSDFTGARLVGTDLRFSCLSEADLVLLDLSRATLDGADATDAQLTSSVLRETSIRGVRGSGAALVNAVMDGTDLRVSPAAGCEDPPPWEAYEDGPCSVDAPPAECACRTRLDGAILDGSNLVGAALLGVDLAQASLLGVTLGSDERVALVQPPSCRPTPYFVCLRTLEYVLDCGFFLMLGEQQARRECAAPEPNYAGAFMGGLQGLDSEARARCLLGLWEAGGCPDAAARQACLDDPDDTDYVPSCTWESIRAAEDLERGAGPSACTVEGEEYFQAECGRAPTVLADVRLDDAQLTAVVLNEVEMSDTRLRGVSLRNAVFIGNNFSTVDFSDADLEDAALSGADLSELDFSNASLRGAALRDARFDGATLQGADLGAADLRDVNIESPVGVPRLDDALLGAAVLRDLSWQGVSMNGAEASGADIRDSDLSEASMQRTSFLATRFLNVNLDQVQLTSAQLISVTIQGSMVRAGGDSAQFVRTRFSVTDARQSLLLNTTWDSTTVTGGDWFQVDLQGASGDGCSFDGVGLGRARLVDSVWLRCSFAGSDLSQADLDDAVAVDSAFTGVDLSSADLRGGQFDRSAFTGADLANARLDNARFHGADLAGVDLTTTRGLDALAGAFDDADLDQATLCVDLREVFQAQNDYRGDAVWVDCD